MKTPQEILRLVERFERNREAYQSGQYNEMQVREEFINPFFEALGWDVHNKKGYAEAYKDVIHEDAIRVGGATKAPDYCFRIGGARKFFLEAKKPSIDLKHDIHPAFQLRRYAWSAKLPLSILTDFEEFAVYDCRIKPVKTDKASTARTLYLTYADYAQHWGEIASVFSRDAVLKGSFDKYVESTRLKKGTAEVDRAFLKEIEFWRDRLARNIALRNTRLTNRELNFAVQRTIDRLIFLRICEDRGIEEYGRIRTLLNGVRVYARLCETFQRADKRYNSGLFHFKKEKDRDDPSDDLTLGLTIDDGVLKEIIRNLYYPDSPYEFSVLPANILGQVYEQFLGKVIRLTPAHRAVVEDKPEVKKAGGVYYTPTYIVDYIVKNTVGKLLDEKTPKQIGANGYSPLRILDPACGSGSFLLGAYQFLLDWHRDWYVADGAEKWATKRVPRLYQAQGGDWRLTTSERKRILLNNIYGVDIDPQAVEVTKLSLLLKVLEGENEQTLSRQLKLLHERALPDLGSNIKCGNSLIGPDFYDNQQAAMFDEEEMYRINVFDWEAEFPEIMQSGGFDAVIGNPPWISLTGRFRNETCSEDEIQYLIQKYSGNTYMPNIYEYFVSNGLNLIRENGFFGFIVPDRLAFNKQFSTLRRRILEDFTVIDLVFKIPFPGITADTLIFVFQNKKQRSNKVPIGEWNKKRIHIKQEDFRKADEFKFEYFLDISTLKLIRKIEENVDTKELNRLCNSTSGFGGKSDLITTSKLKDSQIKTMKGSSIQRYQIIRFYWFEFKKQNITGRTTDKMKLGARPKILLRKTGGSIISTSETEGVFPEQSLYFLYNIQIDPSFLLGILNSKLMNYYYRVKCLTNRESIAQVKKVDLDKLPIIVIDDNEIENRMVTLVEQMLELHKKKAAAKDPRTREQLQRQIDATDRQIDRLVYELYGLTEEEIKIVEESN